MGHAWAVRRVVGAAAAAAALAPFASGAAPSAHVYRIARVIDGDTVVLTTGAHVRLVQIDTPEVYFGLECWGREASAETKRLLPPGTLVRLAVEPATDRVDGYGRLLRYVVRVRDGLNVNVFLVRHGDAAPYFYRGRQGRCVRERCVADCGAPAGTCRSSSTVESRAGRRPEHAHRARRLNSTRSGRWRVGRESIDA
jgi:endonuclease YncB( thermonuclease family)